MNNSFKDPKTWFFPLRAVTCLLVVILLFSGTPDQRTRVLQNPAHHLINLGYRPGKSIMERVRPAGPVLLHHLRIMDNREDYTPYEPTEKEMLIIERYLDVLPPLTKRVLEQRLEGIYFINGFIGSGMTEWAVDENGKIYAYMIFNPRVFSMNVSELLAWKEYSAYKKDRSGIRINFKSSNVHNGFLYILLHESTHVVDYALNVTPYTDPEYRFIMSSVLKTTPFVEGIWKSYRKPAVNFAYEGRVAFYGLGGGPKLRLSEAPEVYRALDGSPFSSLYSALSWAEDLAELLAYYHMVEIMGIEYEVQLWDKNRLLYKGEPLKNPRIRDRFSTLQYFYFPEENLELGTALGF